MSKMATRPTAKSQTIRAVVAGFSAREMVMVTTFATSTVAVDGRVRQRRPRGEGTRMLVGRGLPESEAGKTVDSGTGATNATMVWCCRLSTITTTVVCRTLAIPSGRSEGLTGLVLLFGAVEIGQTPKRFTARCRAKERPIFGKASVEMDGEMRRKEDAGRMTYYFVVRYLDCHYLVRPRYFCLLHLRTAEGNYLAIKTTKCYEAIRISSNARTIFTLTISNKRVYTS